MEEFPMRKMLSENGTIINVPAFLELNLSYETLIRMYQQMLTTYLFSRQMQREANLGMGLYISPEGQIASVACAYAMQTDD